MTPPVASAAAPGVPMASVAVVEQYARELVRKGGATRVLALRAAPSWAGPPVLQVGEEPVLVRACPSALAVREALLERGPRDWLVVLTDRPAEDLGLSLLARMLHQQVEPVDVWHTVPGVFDARTVDPGLRELGPWVAAALVEYRPVGGYPVAPAGVVTRDHALRVLTAAVLGVPADRLDPAGLLAWTADPVARDRWRGLPVPLREGIAGWVRDALGPVAAVALDVAGSPGTVDAVTIGLAADVLWPADGSAPAEALAARVRLEPLVGGRPLPEEPARDLAAAALDLLLRLPGPRDLGPPGSGPGSLLQRSVLLARAEALLTDLGWAQGAQRSALLPAGYEARLRALAARLAAGHDPESALAVLLAHESARAERADVTVRCEMAVRLHRWLATEDDAATDVQQALLRQARDDAWVDRAAADVWAGSVVPEVAAAYAQVCRRVAERRGQHDRAMAALLADATTADLLPADTVGVEDLVARVVRPLASSAGVLLVVVDGMSTAVAAELVDGAVARGWTECVPAGDLRRTAALAVLPTLTRYSRTSLLTGGLGDGGQTDEKRDFPAVGGGPVFHKDDLRAGAGQLLPQPVRDAVASTAPVVAVVLNTVDDALAKHDPGGTDWTIDSVQHLGPLLELAAATGRTVVLTSDHGHVVERGSRVESYDDADARFRPARQPVSGDEVLLTGRRVLAPGGAVVAAVAEDLRYGRKAAGYHGGASAAEVTIPVIVLAQDPQALAPRGWVPAPPQAPRWWYEPVAAPRTPAPAAGTRRPARRPTPAQDQALFEIADVAPVSEGTGGSGWAGASAGLRVAGQVIASPVFAAQQARAARGGLDVDTVAAVLAVLVDGAGRAHRDVVAAAAGVPAARFSPTMVALRRLLNVEGYEVVSTDPDGVTVLLDLTLLGEQFGIAVTR